MSATDLKLEQIVSPDKLHQQFEDLVKAAAKQGKPSVERSDVLQLIKQTLELGRKSAETMLMQDARGTRLLRAPLMVDGSDHYGALIILQPAMFYPAVNPSTSEKMTIIAVGGYGRGGLAPGSDIDLLFLLPYKQTPWGEQVVEYILYMLWDIGLKIGHATRNLDGSVRLSLSDMTIRTSILEARYICGNRELFDKLIERFDKEVVEGTGPAFIEAKLAERDARHKKSGATRYLVEPNVKEGKGGQRDLHSLFWIAKYYYRVKTSDELVKLGALSRAEHNIFRKAEDLLWAVRCHMHFLTGKSEERLSFDIQSEIARRLGYTAHPGQRDVERFMKHYFLVAKEVGDLTRVSFVLRWKRSRRSMFQVSTGFSSLFRAENVNWREPRILLSTITALRLPMTEYFTRTL